MRGAGTWRLFAVGKQAGLDAQVVRLPRCNVLVMCIEVGVDKQQAGVPHVCHRDAHCSFVVPNIPNSCSHQ